MIDDPVHSRPGESAAEVDEPPPFLGTWRRVYTAILIGLTLLIGTLAILTRVFEA